MKKNGIDFEIKLGGIFGGIAVIAIIVEVIVNGMTAEAVVGGIKDIAGTIVSVLVLISAWLALHPRKDRKFDFNKQLERQLKQWQVEHNNMISAEENVFDMYMKTDISHFFSAGATKKQGRFVLIENDSTMKLTFSLNKGLFVGTGKDDTWEEQVHSIGQMIRTYANGIYSDFAEVSYDKSKKNIVISLKEKPDTEMEISKIIDILNTMYQAFLVCASTKR